MSVQDLRGARSLFFPNPPAFRHVGALIDSRARISECDVRLQSCRRQRGRDRC